VPQPLVRNAIQQMYCSYKQCNEMDELSCKPSWQPHLLHPSPPIVEDDHGTCATCFFCVFLAGLGAAQGVTVSAAVLIDPVDLSAYTRGRAGFPSAVDALNASVPSRSALIIGAHGQLVCQLILTNHVNMRLVLGNRAVFICYLCRFGDGWFQKAIVSALV
jgi:hypothetical protein